MVPVTFLLYCIACSRVGPCHLQPQPLGPPDHSVKPEPPVWAVAYVCYPKSAHAGLP